MPMYRYSVQPDAEKTAIASARDVPVKPRHVVNVLKAIKGMRLEQAKNYLEAVKNETQAVRFVRHFRNVKHRRGKLGPGQFPVKAAGVVLQVVKSAEANAEFKGLDPERMWVSHAGMQRSAPIRGMMPRAQGRATPWNTSTCHVNIVLEERDRGTAAPAAEAGEAKPAARRKKPAAKPAKKKEES